jgi:hypothetical protein
MALVALGALAVLAILFFAWRWWISANRSNISVPPPVPAHIRAKQKLEEALALISQPKPFAFWFRTRSDFISKSDFNFARRSGRRRNFCANWRDGFAAVEQKESLGNFLESCDLVKFAKYEPGENELRELHSSAVRLVEETEPRKFKAESEKAAAGRTHQKKS